MNRRALTSLLVVVLALWGVGLPRFAHVMTAHVPGEDGSIACTASCCSQCSLSRAAAEPSEPDEQLAEANLPASQGGGERAHHCSICALLAVLVANVPELPVASPAWEPLAEFAAEVRTMLVPRIDFDPHAPRGPPVAA